MKTTKKTLDFCAIDFETACNYRASACAVGLVRVRGGKIDDTYFTLIKPPEGMEILPSFTRIHGITNKHVERAPGFADAWPAMRDFIGSDLLVAHNCGFDRGVLRYCLEHYGIEDAVPAFECTVVCSRKKWPELENHKLNTVSDFLGIELTHHEALSDAIACARIYVAAHS